MTRHKWKWSPAGNGSGTCLRCGTKTKVLHKNGLPTHEVFSVVGGEWTRSRPACVFVIAIIPRSPARHRTQKAAAEPTVTITLTLKEAEEYADCAWVGLEGRVIEADDLNGAMNADRILRAAIAQAKK